MSARIPPFAPLMGLAAQHWRKTFTKTPAPVSRKPGPFHVAKPAFVFGNADLAPALLGGYFEYANQSVDVGKQGDPWTVDVPSERFAQWLHRFSWLPDLVAGHANSPRTQSLIDSWILNYTKYNAFAWTPEVMAERCYHWLLLWSSGLQKGASETLLERRRLSVFRQTRMLRQVYGRLPHGLDRFYAAAAITLLGARMHERGDVFLAKGLDLLDAEIDAQILPDGGHISRNPETALRALEILLSLDSVLDNRGVEGSRTLSRAIDRIAPLVCAFTHADGGLAVFHGGGQIDKARVARVIKAAPGAPKAFGYGPHVGFQRLAQGDNVLLVDTGSAPPRPFDTDAHMSPLAFELSTGDGRMIVNCGWSRQQPSAWRRPVRAAAAHSALILDGRSPGRLLDIGWKTRALGEAVAAPAGPTKAARKEQSAGVWLEASHDGYRSDYGLTHRRRFFMPQEGDDIRGEDSLYVPLGAAPTRRDEVPFEIRFHVHPDVRVSLSQDQSSALLIINGRAGWRFRTDGGPLSLEDSVYLARGARPVKTQQIVIRGHAFCDGDGESRSNRVRWSFRKLKGNKG